MMNRGSILVLLQMVKKEATNILVAEQGEAEWPYHWYSEVLYKRFLTPFRDGVLNRRQVSDCDRGALAT